MYCLVDFRNRPQFQYTFSHSRQSPRIPPENKKQSSGNYRDSPDGRREYFENGLPQRFLADRERPGQLKKGCHVKYRIQKFNTTRRTHEKKICSELKNQATGKINPFFLFLCLATGKCYARIGHCLAFMFSSSFYFQKQYGQNAVAQSKIHTTRRASCRSNGRKSRRRWK